MEKLIFKPDVLKQLFALILNRHFELSLKNMNIDLVYNQHKLLTLVFNGSIEYIPKKK